MPHRRPCRVLRCKCKLDTGRTRLISRRGTRLSHQDLHFQASLAGSDMGSCRDCWRLKTAETRCDEKKTCRSWGSKTSQQTLLTLSSFMHFGPSTANALSGPQPRVQGISLTPKAALGVDGPAPSFPILEEYQAASCPGLARAMFPSSGIYMSG